MRCPRKAVPYIACIYERCRHSSISRDLIGRIATHVTYLRSDSGPCRHASAPHVPPPRQKSGLHAARRTRSTEYGFPEPLLGPRYRRRRSGKPAAGSRVGRVENGSCRVGERWLQEGAARTLRKVRVQPGVAREPQTNCCAEGKIEC